MAWIPIIDEDEAPAELAELYERTRDPESGRVDHIMAIHSLHPGGLDAHHRLYREVMTPTASLRKAERELIAFVVSRLNDCHY